MEPASTPAGATLTVTLPTPMTEATVSIPNPVTPVIAMQMQVTTPAPVAMPTQATASVPMPTQVSAPVVTSATPLANSFPGGINLTITNGMNKLGKNLLNIWTEISIMNF
jgi:hypothetical protein